MDKEERVSVSYEKNIPCGESRRNVTVCHGQEISVLTGGEEK